ncbi:MAG: carnitine dehydratase [Rhodobacter sp. BACL10 MAG-121220-bin24]|jgi:itaconate CoA-transferase|nr:MAG: carnitine dehydratase [Rhodobacter sp. BACL10 MAG-120910-bin24]KRO90574.1 MAG: carnitine dehydratase [Rhodobacter sp. BACL10 MAG-121220-bin24]KRP22551.1 MAG: carnitine dehydratase [Rhodobacter sp. BACL10 MAG-120419-bin15]|tara:strand:+ start:2452 stop:3567 length:1116 start_codon:yes stop_codon:yes gene_type:complete
MISQLPLHGISVISLEQAVSAPFTSARLADAGAEVTKVERPGGDFARGYDKVAAGQSSYFVWLNRGKKSVTLDIASKEGKSKLMNLISTSDVLIQNLKHGSLAKLGFDLNQLRENFPKLIICSITGYGECGPMSDRKAYDLLVQAETGLCSITGGPDEPARVGISIVDIATGATAYSAILEALIRRSLTKRGAQISISMFDVMAEWLTVPLLNHEGGHPPKRIGLAHPSIAPYGVFYTNKGPAVLISVQSDKEWVDLCSKFIGKPDLGVDPKFATNVARVKNRRETDAIVADAFKKFDSKRATYLLKKASIAFASMNDMDTLSQHPHLRRISVETPNGTVSMPAPAPIWDGESRQFGPVPELNGLEPQNGH